MGEIHTSFNLFAALSSSLMIHGVTGIDIDHIVIGNVLESRVFEELIPIR